MKGVVYTCEYPLSQQFKLFRESLCNKLAHKGYSVIAYCIWNKEALKDGNKLFTAKQPNPDKWKKKVKKAVINELGIVTLDKEGKLQFYKANDIYKNIKDIDIVEWQAEPKQKKDKKQDYNDRMRTGFTLVMGQIDLSVKQDLSTRHKWNNIKNNNLLIDILELLTTICDSSANRNLKLMMLHGMVQMKKCLTYLQGKGIKDLDYKDSVKTQITMTKAQAADLPMVHSHLKWLSKKLLYWILLMDWSTG